MSRAAWAAALAAACAVLVLPGAAAQNVGTPVIEAPTVTQLSNGNVIVDMPTGQLFKIYCGDDSSTTNALHDTSYLSGIVAANYHPVEWEYFGKPVITDQRLGLVRTDAEAWIQHVAPLQAADFPITVNGAMVVFNSWPSNAGTYTIYQLRTNAVPENLPAPLATGTFPTRTANQFDTGTINNVLTVDVALVEGNGSYIYVVAKRTDTLDLYSNWSVRGGVAAGSGFRAAVLAYGGLHGTGDVDTVVWLNNRDYFRSTAYATMRLAVGDVLIMQPNGSAAGTLLHTIKPTILRFGTGPAPSANALQTFPMEASVPTPVGALVESVRPLYDITGAAYNTDGSQIFIPKEHLYDKVSPLKCRIDVPRFDATRDHNNNIIGNGLEQGRLVWSGNRVLQIPFTATAAAESDITPTGTIYTGVASTEAPTVVPGTGGRITVSRNVYTPLVPLPAEGPDETPIAPFGSYGTTDRAGTKYVYASIPAADIVNGWSCELIDRLHPGGYPGQESTVGGTRTYMWARGGTPLADDAVGFGGYTGTLRLSCDIGLSSGTTVAHRTIQAGTPGVLGPGAVLAIAAYQDDRLGWGAPDFMGLGLVASMGLITAMVGFSRKNLAGSAIIFAAVIGAMGWIGLMNVTEAMMAGITVAVILIVFQRSGGRG